MKRPLALLAGLALIAIGAAVLLLRVPTGPTPTAPTPVAPAPTTAEVVAPPAAPSSRPTPRERPSGPPPSAVHQNHGSTATAAENKDEEPPPPPTDEELEAALDPGPEGVKQAMVEMRPMLAQCYADALADVPDLAPKLDIKFTVTARHGLGRVRGVHVTNDDVDDPAMVDCMSAAMEGLAFKPPTSPMSVTFPMAFRAP